MEPNNGKDVSYKPCSVRFPKNTTADVTVPPELQAAYLEDYRVLPLTEKTMLEHVYKWRYSFRDNAYLACRWREFRDHQLLAKTEPFQFPDVRDYHFYMQDTRFAPRQSQRLVAASRVRRALATGCAVDHVGPVPWPQDLHHHSDLGVHKKVNQKPETGKKHSFLKRKK